MTNTIKKENHNLDTYLSGREKDFIIQISNYLLLVESDDKLIILDYLWKIVLQQQFQHK